MSRIKQKNYKVYSFMDTCHTPPEAVRLLVPYLKRMGVKKIWEPAVGMFHIENELRTSGFLVCVTGLYGGGIGQDFLTYDPGFEFDVIVTNPPFSLDYAFIKRCMEFGKPWALLMKTDRARVKRCRDAGLFKDKKLQTEIIVPSSRICYEMPNKKWESSAQFHTSWFTYGFDIGSSMIEVEYVQEKRCT